MTLFRKIPQVLSKKTGRCVVGLVFIMLGFYVLLVFQFTLIVLLYLDLILPGSQITRARQALLGQKPDYWQLCHTLDLPIHVLSFYISIAI